MSKKKGALTFKIFKGLLRFFYPVTEIVGAENLPTDPAVIVANHSQIHGPIICELYYPRDQRTWCAGQMMNVKEIPSYAYADFWSQKPKASRWFYKILSYLITPIAYAIFNNAKTVGVYRDMRISSTFRTSVEAMKNGADIIIFPECDAPGEGILYKLQKNFVDLARIYYKRCGRELDFVPAYIAPRLKKMFIGKPIRYCADNPPEVERGRICALVAEQINDLARELPRHRVVPYRNIAKRKYPYNK